MSQREPVPLSLKVMRLSKPSFSTSQFIGLDLGEGEQFSAITRTLKSTYLDFPPKYGIISKHVEKNASLRRKPGYILPLTEKLVLPKDFGILYLGETFYCQFLLTNESLSELTNIKCTCEIQSNSQKTLLFCNEKDMGHAGPATKDLNLQVPPNSDTRNSQRSVNLSSRQIYNFQTKYETKELGLHVLLCTIEYTDQTNAIRMIKRSFKFYIENPIIVKTKTNHCLQQPDKIFLEIQVQTTSSIQACMYVQKFQLEPSAEFVAIDLNNGGTLGMVDKAIHPLPVTGKSDDGSNNQTEIGLGKLNCKKRDKDIALASVWKGDFIGPQEIRQYLYLLVPKETYSGTANLSVDSVRKIRYLSVLGKLNIAWTWSFGSTGRLQTSQLIRNSPGLHLIEVLDIVVTRNSVSVLEKDDTFERNNEALVETDIDLQKQAQTQKQMLRLLEPQNLDERTFNLVSSSQSIVVLEEPFTVRFVLTNTSDSDMNIYARVDLNNTNPETTESESVDNASSGQNLNDSMLISGPSEFDMGIFKPAESKDLNVSYLPIALGVHNVGCLIVKDLNSDYTRKIYSAHTVFVIDS